MTNKYQPLRGMKDIIGDDSNYFQNIIDISQTTANNYGYKLLLPPILEQFELFHRSIGETSDIVSKETYTFEDRDGSKITMRPEFTASVVRSLISNGLTQSLPQKLFSYGPVFRHERPQKCRYRQFYQINMEHFGANGFGADAEVIYLAYEILKQLNLIDHVVLNLNTLGDKESRVKYRELLVTYFNKYLSDLSAESKIRLLKNPLRILDSKDEKDKQISADAPKITTSLNLESRHHFDNLQNALTKLGVSFITNDTLVRGLDYYTHTVFEFITDFLGTQGTVLGGGRYDGLVEFMGGPSIPAIGFAGGVERLAELKKIVAPLADTKSLIYLLPIGANAEIKAISIAAQLRSNNIKTELDFYGNISKKMKRADKLKASKVVIFGDEELRTNSCKLKDMASGDERLVAQSDLLNSLK